jgi:hypothetical protein
MLYEQRIEGLESFLIDEAYDFLPSLGENRYKKGSKMSMGVRGRENASARFSGFPQWHIDNY